MFKKILFILLVMIINYNVASANDLNFLNSVVLGQGENGYQIVLRADSLSKVKKTIEANDKIVLTLSNITTSNDTNTVYKDISDINGVIVENVGNNSAKIHIHAPKISKAKIFFEVPNSAPILVNDNSFSTKILWTIFSLLILALVTRSARKNKTDDILYNYEQKVIIDREMTMYNNLRQEIKFARKMPVMNYNPRERAYMSNSLNKGRTIREYKNNNKSFV
ncbi:MAG: hypothetical protein R3Y28_06580 [Candidatus Gastranaerophilales bacterium]